MRRRYRRRKLFSTRRRSSSGFGSLLGIACLIGALSAPFTSNDDKPITPTPTPRRTAIVQTVALSPTPSPRPSSTPSPTAIIVSATQTPQVREYVLNTNTMRFHYTHCKHVSSIKQKNRKDFTGTRTIVIEMGFVPCKVCNP